jgi:hypothetical protein
MDRRSSGFLFILISVTFSLIALSGCVGKSTRNDQPGGVQTVTLNPSADVSLELGKTQIFTASARNSAGGTVFTTIHFIGGCTDQIPCAPISIADNGTACAGSWDSLSNPVRCTPGVAGVATVTAEAEGVSSAPTTVYIHEHIQNIQVTPLSPPTTSCFSQGTAWNFQATALSANGVDITNTVGPMSWSSTTLNVLTVDSVKGLPNNQIQVTAKEPGITQLFASISGTSSTPLDYTTCLVRSVMLQIQNGSGNTVTINAGSTKTIEATAVDTLGITLSKPVLTWSTSNPEVATVTSSGVVTARQNGGAASISASCTPPTCNIGVLPGLPVYSSGGTLPNGQTGFGVITAQVTNPKPPTATAWAATTDCGNNFNCTSVTFPVTAGNTPVGASVTVPFTPNSMIFIPGGTRAYLGSDKGLMFLDVAGQGSISTVSQATSPCNVAVCGKVLSISPDGNRVVVSDTVTQPNQVYIFDAAHATSAPTDLLIAGATAAAFSPDQMKIFILSNTGQMYVVSTVDALTSVAIAGSASGAAFSADGSFAYVAGTPGNTVSGYSVCTTNNVPDNVLNGVPVPGFPIAISPLPDLQFDHLGRLAQSILVVTPPTIDTFTVAFAQNPPVEQPPNSGKFFCQPPTVQLDNLDFPPTSFDLGQGNFTPLLMQVTGDGSQVILVAQNIPAVLIFDVKAGTTREIPLANGASPLAASATQDGTQVFVAACDADHADPNTCGSVHIVNTQSGGDLQQAVYTNLNTNDSMCTNLGGTTCLPNLIAVRPQ